MVQPGLSTLSSSQRIFKFCSTGPFSKISNTFVWRSWACTCLNKCARQSHTEEISLVGKKFEVSLLLYILYFSSHNFLNINLRVLITRAAAEEAPGRKPGNLRTRACVQLVNNGSWRKTRSLLMHRIHIRWYMPILFGADIFHFNQKKVSMGSGKVKIQGRFTPYLI